MKPMAAVLMLAGVPLATAVGQQTPIPEALVGVWKGTEVPGRWTDAMTGATMALIGWHGQLELAADGRYRWIEYREGEVGGCRVSTLRNVSGSATVDGTVLVLGAAPGAEAQSNGCSQARSYANRPITLPVQRFNVNMAWTVTVAGWETLRLTLSSPDRTVESMDFASEPHIEWPAANLGEPVPSQPIPSDLPSLWVWPVEVGQFPLGGPAAFAAPRTDAHWLRLGADGRYEWAGWKANVLPGPGCTLGVLAYERGRYRVAQGAYDWTMLTEPDSASVLERRSGCGAEDGDRILPVPLHPSRYSWSIGHTPDAAEVLEVKCPAEPRDRNRYQILLCHWVFEFRSLFSRVKP
jgi:hypothetical protein